MEVVRLVELVVRPAREQATDLRSAGKQEVIVLGVRAILVLLHLVGAAHTVAVVVAMTPMVD